MTDEVLVVTAADHDKGHIQKMSGHTARQGLAWGAVVGAAIGVILPPSILAGAVWQASRAR